MLRVVSGIARGTLLLDVNKDTTRPVTSRIKTSLFDKLQFFIADEKIADLYSGTGSMGIEALSRGAAFCDFVDMDSDCAEIIKKNLEKTKLVEKAKVFRSSVREFVSKHSAPDSYQAILYDPPFPIVTDSYQQIREELLSFIPLLKEEGAVIFRHPRNTFQNMPEYEVISQKEYGISEITIITPILPLAKQDG